MYFSNFIILFPMLDDRLKGYNLRLILAETDKPNEAEKWVKSEKKCVISVSYEVPMQPR